MSEYPEHEKMKRIADESQAIGRFLEWLGEEREVRVHLMASYSLEADKNGKPIWRDEDGKIVRGWDKKWRELWRISVHSDKELQEEKERRGIDRRYVPDPQGETFFAIRETTEKLLAEYFDIDLDKIEDERRQMLDECRAMSEKGVK